MLIQILALFLLCSIAYSYFVPPVLFGNVIRDLYSNSTNDMIMLATQWTMFSWNGEPNVKVGNFSGEPVLGGPDVGYGGGNFDRTYDQLPAHTVVYLDISLAVSDEWSGYSCSIVLFVDNSFGYAFQLHAPQATDAFPGTPNVLTTHLVGKLYHWSSSLTLKLQYSLGSWTSWASIRDISLSFRNESLDIEGVNIALFQPSYSCSAGYYLNGTACLSCHASCQNCFGSSNSQCYSCAQGFSFVGNQCVKCPANCQFCSNGSIGQCLLCKAGYTLDFDGTCHLSSTCKTSPYVIENNNDISPSTAYSSSFCVEPCPSGTSMLWNYTCIKACNPPLQEVISNGHSYCNYPCNKTNNEYLYANGSCLTSCEANPINDTGYLFCGKLCPGYIFDPNGTCIATCPPLYTVRLDSDTLFCSFPCESNEFLYSDGTCSSTCHTNFIITMEGTNKLCNYPCQTGDYLYDNGTCLETCSPGFTVSGQGDYQYCSPPYNSSNPNTTSNSNQTTNSSTTNPYPCYVTSLYDANIMITNCSNLNQNNSCPPGYFQYQNGSCLHLCIDPYYGILRNGSAYCYSPSSFPGDQNSCLPGDNSTTGNTNSTGNSTTDNGNSTTPNNNTDTNNSTTYSNGCSGATFYKYSNGSCLATCSSPFLFVWQNGAAYCDFPCASGSYISANGSCITSCSPGETPQIQGYFMFCESTSNNNTSSGGTNSTNSTNSPSVILEIYIRYNISLVDFNSLDGLKLFVQQLATILGIDPYYITIVSLREGSTIIQSQISIASSSDQESMNAAMDLAETMGNTVSNAVANNQLDIINGVSILDYDKSIQVVKTATGDSSNQIQVSSRSSNDGAVIGLGAGLGALGLIMIGFGIYRYKINSKLKRTKQDNTKGEAYKVEANINTNHEAKDESMARMNDYKEGETVKSRPLDEIDIRIEGSETNHKQEQEKEQPVIELAVHLETQTNNIEPKSIRVERKASISQEYHLEQNMTAYRERRNDNSLEIQASNEIEPTKELSFEQPKGSSSNPSSIEELDFYIEGQTDQQDQQEEDPNADMDIFVQGREVENQNVEKQEDAEEKPVSLGALLRQNL